MKVKKLSNQDAQPVCQEISTLVSVANTLHDLSGGLTLLRYSLDILTEDVTEIGEEAEATVSEILNSLAMCSRRAKRCPLNW